MFTKIGDAAIRVVSYINRKLKKVSTTKLKVLTICSGILFFCLLFVACAKCNVICLIFSIAFGLIFGFSFISLCVRYANEANEKEKEEAYKRIRQLFFYESTAIEVEIITGQDKILQSCVQVMNTLNVRHIATIKSNNTINVYSVYEQGKIKNTDVTIYNPLYFEKHYKLKQPQ